MSDTPARPKVSIGMPLYNATNLLKRALDSLLSQTFRDFELIISDNASTDDTWAICESYARKDSRIRLHRNEVNRGAAYNFQYVLELAQGEYFMWAAYDDQWDSAFLAACVEQLDRHPEAVLCYTYEERHYLYENRTLLVNANLDISHSDARVRVQRLIARKAMAHSTIYGLIRKSVLKEIAPLAEILNADLLVLLHIALQGPFVSVNQLLRHSYHTIKKSHRARIEEMNLPLHKYEVVLVFSRHIQMCRAFSDAILRSRLSVPGKISLLPYVVSMTARSLVRSYLQMAATRRAARK